MREESLDSALRRFWEFEEIFSQSSATDPEAEECENIYSRTVTRTPDGRYIVRLPFKNEQRPSLGSTRQTALLRLSKLEERFGRNPEFQELYINNFTDYLKRDHMSPATKLSNYIMPHHGVTKHSPEGMKVRVVFSPIEKDPSGVSLNDTLHIGPNLQSDIGSIVTQFRLHVVAVACDIRAILLHPEDRIFQYVLWRFSLDEPVDEWKLNTVTFGVASSLFLAQRTLVQLVKLKTKVKNSLVPRRS